MRIVIVDWIQFIERAGSLIGLLMVASGAVFMLSGWRLARMAMIAIYALIGIGAGVALAPESLGPTTTAIAAGTIVAGLGYSLKDYAAPVLAGIIGTLGIWAILGSSTIPAPTIFIVLFMVFVRADRDGVEQPHRHGRLSDVVRRWHVHRVWHRLDDHGQSGDGAAFPLDDEVLGVLPVHAGRPDRLRNSASTRRRESPRKVARPQGLNRAITTLAVTVTNMTTVSMILRIAPVI